jgi:hypothetical protein
VVLSAILRDPALDPGQVAGRDRNVRLDRCAGFSASPVKSGRYRPVFAHFSWLFVVACIGLGWLGTKSPEGIYLTLSRLLTFYYFAYFLLVLPLLGRFEKTRPLPKKSVRNVRFGQCQRESRQSAYGQKRTSNDRANQERRCFLSSRRYHSTARFCSARRP